MYSPYGTQLSHNGNSISQYTSKGFTGQYTDPTSGLDDYVSRYYDPVAGIFLSADGLEGNLLGMNPYGYVGGNPETWNDPTGEAFIPPGGGGGGGGNSGSGGSGLGNGSGGASTGGSGGGPYMDAPPEIVPAVVREAEQIAQWAWDNPGEAITIATVALFVVDTAPVWVPIALGVLGLALILSIPSSSALPNTTASSTPTPNLGPIPTPGSDIHLPDGVNSLTPGHSHSMVTPGGSGSGRKPPPTTTASPPDEPSGGKTPKNLFRNGNATSSKIGNVRVTSDFEEFQDGPFDVLQNEEGNICAGGQSTYEYRTKPGKWWMLPAGTDIPEGLQVVQDDPNDPTHWSWQPTRPMGVDEFTQLVSGIQGWQQAFTKVPASPPPASPPCE